MALQLGGGSQEWCTVISLSYQGAGSEGVQGMRSDVADYFERYRSIPGWFFPADFRLFDFLLSSQAGGDLAEIGVYEASRPKIAVPSNKRLGRQDGVRLSSWCWRSCQQN